MSTPEHSPMAPQPARIGQATAIEQSRAAAEVHGRILVAQSVPRDTAAAIAEMRESCAQLGLAERAFYRYPKGGQTVTGESIHLARELARCWRNMDFGISELSRNFAAGESEMYAFAWDMQANTRNSQTFIVPHARDTKRGVQPLIDLRDVYENNANMGARRLRAAILAVLPPWFVEEAKTLCYQTLAKGESGKSLAQSIADVVKAFEDAAGVTVGQLETKLSRKTTQWTAHDLAQLRVTYTSIARGEVTVEDEFPPVRVTVEEIANNVPAPATPPVDEPSHPGQYTPDEIAEGS